MTSSGQRRRGLARVHVGRQRDRRGDGPRRRGSCDAPRRGASRRPRAARRADGWRERIAQERHDLGAERVADVRFRRLVALLRRPGGTRELAGLVRKHRQRVMFGSTASRFELNSWASSSRTRTPPLRAPLRRRADQRLEVGGAGRPPRSLVGGTGRERRALVAVGMRPEPSVRTSAPRGRCARSRTRRRRTRHATPVGADVRDRDREVVARVVDPAGGEDALRGRDVAERLQA